jgi:hypothetical protein
MTLEEEQNHRIFKSHILMENQHTSDDSASWGFNQHTSDLGASRVPSDSLLNFFFLLIYLIVFFEKSRVRKNRQISFQALRKERFRPEEKPQRLENQWKRATATATRFASFHPELLASLYYDLECGNVSWKILSRKSEKTAKSDKVGKVGKKTIIRFLSTEEIDSKLIQDLRWKKFTLKNNTANNCNDYPIQTFIIMSLKT